MKRNRDRERQSGDACLVLRRETVRVLSMKQLVTVGGGREELACPWYASDTPPFGILGEG